MSAARRPALGGRREAREQALLLLYEYEVRGGDLDEVIGDRSDTTWLIARGDPLPRRVAWTTTPRQSPQSHSGSPAGPLPIADDSEQPVPWVLRVATRRAGSSIIRSPSCSR